MNKRGFTLIEVLVSISILAMVIVSVFYYFSGAMRGQQKLNQKYVQLRIAREFIDNFNQEEERGREEKEDYVIEWQTFPLEKSRKQMGGISGGSSVMQLKLVHLDVIHKRDDKNKLSINFIYNVFLSNQR